MGVAFAGQLAIRKVIPLDLFRNARFQCALDDIAGQVVGSGVVAG